MRNLIIILLLFSAFLLLAQSKSKIRIIHSDYNIGRKVHGEQLRILKGSVHVTRDTINMHCDSAYFYEARNVLELMGKVIIINGQRTIKAHRIIYYPDDNITECLGNVRATSPGDSLFTQRLVYNLRDEDATATKDVFLYSKTDKAIITGEKGYFDNKLKYARVTENSYLFQIDTTSSDTFQVWANSLEYYGDTLNFACATGNVKLKQGNFTALCDTAWYYSKKEVSLLRGNPHVWFDNSELVGDYIDASFDSTALKHIDVKGNAIAKTLNDSLKGEYNIITGKNLEFFIEEKKPVRIIARNNASSIYYIEQDNDSGSNYSTSDSIFVYFREGELDSIRIIGGAQGTYYPDSFKGEKSFDN
jgi:lipopolysaccharide export system protein LptA